MSKKQKLIALIAALTLLMLALAVPVGAFESREGQKIIISAGEVVEDDLYAFADTVTVDGIIKGDLVAFGSTITVNGTVEGDLISAGQAVIINGAVNDDARIAGAALQLTPKAIVGDDLIAAGASLETQAGSQVKGDLVVGSAQVMAAGDVAGDVNAGTAGLELRGDFGGDVHAYVDVTGESEGMPPLNMYMTDLPISIPSVPAGLTVADGAKIAGDLDYTSTIELPVPSGVVGGKITRTEPAVDPETVYIEPTSAEKVGTWALDLLRQAVTFILFGLCIGWLFPKFLHALPEQVRAKPWASLGWGAVTYALFFFILLAVILVMVLGGWIFGAFTLGGLAGTIVWVGLLALFTLVVGFVLATSYLTKVIVGETIGKWLFARFNPEAAEHKIWPMILGVVVIILVVGVLRFPLIPIGFLGWMVNFAIILIGLGALWLWGRQRFTKPASE